MRAFATLAVLLALGGLAVPGQAPRRRHRNRSSRRTFKVEVNYVEIDAVVTDAQGNFVGDLTQRRLPGRRGRQAADHFRVHPRRHPDRAAGSAAVQAGGDRAGRPVRTATSSRAACSSWSSTTCRPTPARTMLVRAAARQFIRRYVGANDMVAVVTTGGSAYGRPGVHEQPPAAAGRGREVHGTETRRDAPDMERGLQGAQHLRHARRTSPTSWPRSAAGARPSSGSAKASTTTSTTPSPHGTPTSSDRPCRTRLRRRRART